MMKRTLYVCIFLALANMRGAVAEDDTNNLSLLNKLREENLVQPELKPIFSSPSKNGQDPAEVATKNIPAKKDKSQNTPLTAQWYKQQLSELNNKNKQLQSEILTVKKKLSAITNEPVPETLEAQARETARQLSDTQQALHKANEDNARLSASVQQAEQDRAKLDAQIAKLASQQMQSESQATQQLADAQAAEKKVSDENSRLQVALKQATQDKTKLDAQIATLTAQQTQSLSQSAKQLADAQAAAKKAADESLRLQAEVKQAAQDKAKVEAQTATLSAQQAQMTKQLVEAQAAEKKASNENLRIQAVEKQAAQEKTKFDAQIAALTAEKNQLSGQLAKQQADAQSGSKKWADEQAALTAELANVKKQLAEKPAADATTGIPSSEQVKTAISVDSKAGRLAKRAYSLGYFIGLESEQELRKITAFTTEVDQKIVLKGLLDRFNHTPLLTDKQIEASLAVIDKEINENATDKGNKNKVLNEQLMAKAAKMKNAVKAKSNFIYLIHKPGSALKVTPTDSIRLRIVEKLGDGTVIASEKDNNVIAAAVKDIPHTLQEVVVKLGIGGEATLYIPPKLAYGEKGVAGKIPPNSLSIMTIKVLGIKER
jgi:FKBP-type peptidyl-prolyl cis-trans isomerase